MLKGDIINGQLLGILGETGHMDWITVCDAGLPIPLDKERVDFALTPGIPRILDVVKLIVGNMVIEKAFIAEEIKSFAPNYYKKLLELLATTGCEIEYVPHIEFKKKTQDENTRAFVRTGEHTSYSSVILQAGVTYGGEMD